MRLEGVGHWSFATLADALSITRRHWAIFCAWRLPHVRKVRCMYACTVSAEITSRSWSILTTSFLSSGLVLPSISRFTAPVTIASNRGSPASAYPGAVKDCKYGRSELTLLILGRPRRVLLGLSRRSLCGEEGDGVCQACFARGTR